MEEVLDIVLEKRVRAVSGSVTVETTGVPTPVELEFKHFGKGEEHGVVIQLRRRTPLRGALIRGEKE